MTARTVTGTVELAGGSGVPLAGARVSADLYAAGEPVFGASGDSQVGGSATMTDRYGSWTLELEPNAGISPSGTVWQISIKPQDRQATSFYISVPDTAGPHAVLDILTEAPEARPVAVVLDDIGSIVQRSSEYDIRDYLASGESSTDCTAAIGSALTALPSGGTLHFPAGTWQFDPGTVTLPDGTTFTGVGAANGPTTGPTTLQAKAGTGTLLTMGNYCHLQQMCVKGTSTAGADGVLFSGSVGDTNGSRSSLTNVRVASFDNNIVINYAWIITFTHVFPVSARSAGVLLTGNNANAITWSGGEAVGNTYGMLIDCTTAEHDSITCVGVTFEGNTRHGIKVSGASSPRYVQGLSLLGCYFEANWSTDDTNADACDVLIEGALHQGVVVKGCRFQTTRTSLDVDGSTKPVIEGNVFRPTARCVVLGADCSYPHVGTNVYHSGTAITDNSSTGPRLGLGVGAVSPSATLHVDGAIRSGQYATASRPSAATVGAGAMVYDSTLSIPVWSNGTVWKDAAGTTV